MANVLLVDDHVAVRSAVSRYLTRRGGHEVTEADSGRSALEKVGPDVDVVVTDLEMPGMGGAQLLEALRERGIHAPVILMSGRFPHQEEAARAAYVLLKPFNPQELCDLIDRFARGAPTEDVTADG